MVYFTYLLLTGEQHFNNTQEIPPPPTWLGQGVGVAVGVADGLPGLRPPNLSNLCYILLILQIARWCP